MTFERFVPGHVVLREPTATALGDRKKNFLEVFAQTGLVTAACESLAEDKKEVYRWRARDRHFAKAWDTIAREMIVPVLEEEAARRALAGSDALLMFLLKSYQRPVFDDKVALMQSTGTGLSITIKDVTGKVIATTDPKAETSPEEGES